LCGDIHKRAIFDIPNNRRAVMIGSLIQQNFGESITKHGYGIYTIDDDNYEFVDLNSPQPHLSFKITSYDDIKNNNEILTNK
jgi:DNA repair exonuclease SbcCD nuclease subunit